MLEKQVEFWPYRIYNDNLGTLYVHDKEEGLTFARGVLSPGKYDFGVIIEEDNEEYPVDILSPIPPYGFQLYDEISLDEWKKFMREYFSMKRMINDHDSDKYDRRYAENMFRKWLHQFIYKPIANWVSVTEYWIESVPNFDDPEHEWEKFNKAWDNFTGIDRFRDKEEKPRYNQYSFTGRNNHFYESPKEMFIKNIEQLLEFTEKT